MNPEKQAGTFDFPLRPVDTASPVPLYHQIYQDLKELILSGVIPSGSLLPPEMELCQAYGVGRHTMRVAIGKLVGDNLVERFAGRGTYIKNQVSRMKFYLDCSFSQQMRDLGYRPWSRILSISNQVIDRSAPEPLHRQMGAPCLVLVRLRFGNEQPVSVQTTTILTEKCPSLIQHDFSQQSLYEILANEYHLLIDQIQHVVRAVAAEEYLADLLQVAVGSPLLYVGTTAFLEDRQVIECTESYYRADKYEYSTTHSYLD